MAWTVRFVPEQVSCSADQPLPLSIAAARCDLLLESACASASCGRCRVQVLDGTVPAHAADLAALGADAVAAGWRLGCRLVLDRDALIHVPASTRVVAHKSFGEATVEVAARAGHGIALDIGTTTLAAAVVSLADGTVLATRSALNPQVRHGADVMSRIAFGTMSPEHYVALRQSLLRGLNTLTAAVCADAGLPVDSINEVVAVGNPTMMHNLRNLPIESLGQAPFHGVDYGSWCGPAQEIGLDTRADAYIPASIHGHVGADTTAAIIATGLDATDQSCLLLDLGTNTELVLRTPDALLCTSAAAAPAFEGAEISHGMRAVPGAIDQVCLSPTGVLIASTIDNREPVGLCGSGLLDATAMLLEAGVIDITGRIRPSAELRGNPLAERLHEQGATRAIQLARGVLITARDVRQLQLVKASIAAAVQLLLESAGISAPQLGAVLLAGAFGSCMNGRSARRLGLLPAGTDRATRFVGNAAGAGARMLLLNPALRARADRAAAATEYVELAGRPDYQDALVAMLPFDPRIPA